MKELLIYILKVNVYFTVLYLLYRLWFHRFTFFTLNRWYLMTIVFVSILLPFVQVPSVSTAMSYGTYMLEVFALDGTTSSGTTPSVNWYQVLALVYLTGLLFTLIQFAINLIRLGKMIRQSEKKQMETYILLLPKEGYPTFTFLNYLHFNPRDRVHKEAIEAHELVHVRQRHSIDNLSYELFKACCWFNPFAYYAHTSLRNVHEYLADREVVQEKMNKANYAQLLLQQATQLKELKLTTTFFQFTNLKKRITMMNTKPTKSIFRANYLFFFPVLLVLFLANSHSNSAVAQLADNNPPAPLAPPPPSPSVTDDTLYTKTDQMPAFNNGKSKLIDYMIKNLTYPKQSKKDGVEGVVYVEFVVDEMGKTTGINVLKGVNSELDTEALRVAKNMPNWTPGVHEGKSVKVKMVLPVRFALK